MAEIGELAPDFMLVDQNQKQVTLGQYKGDKNVVLSWHVHSFTSG
jgi:peroxiredoxin